MAIRNFLILLVVILLFLFSFYKCTPQKETSKPQITEITKSPNGIQATGVIESYRDSITIGTPVSGIVKKVYVNLWDKVSKGDPLFELDNSDIIAELYVHESDVALAEAQIKSLQQELSQFKTGSMTNGDRDLLKAKKNEIALAEAKLKHAQAEVSKTKLMLEKLIVTAPQKGVIVKNEVHQGEFLQAAAPNPLMIIGDTDQLLVRVAVDEKYISLLKGNPSAEGFTKDRPNNPYSLRFLRIEPQLVSKYEGGEKKGYLEVIYTLQPNKNDTFFIGQSLDVYIK